MSQTLAGPAVFEEVIERSRFLARAWPIEDVDAALAHVAECAREEASHHCWAYRHGQQYRFHDANEPAGTAGRPILQAIDGQGCDRVLVVVTRWFGGIKLGAGGLVRAYGGAAAECLRRAPKRQLIEMAEFGVRVDFAAESMLRQLVAEFTGALSGEVYDAQGLSCRVRMPAAQVDAFTIRLRDASRGRATVTTDH